MGTYSAIACQEVAGSAIEGGDVQSGFHCSVVLQCTAANRYALMDDILGTPRAWPKFANGPLAGQASARPMNLDYTESGQECNYTGDYHVSVNYNSQIVDTASESLEPSTDYQQINPQRFHWTNGNTGPVLDEGETVPFIQRRLDIVRTRYRMAALPNEYLTCLGKVNSAQYVSAILGLTFAAETLLFQPQGAQRSFTNIGSSGWTATIRFAYNPNGWNKFWNTVNQAWEFIYIGGAGTTPYKPYQLANFAALFA